MTKIEDGKFTVSGALKPEKTRSKSGKQTSWVHAYHTEHVAVGGDVYRVAVTISSPMSEADLETIAERELVQREKTALRAERAKALARTELGID